MPRDAHEVFVSLVRVTGLAPYRRSPGGEYEQSRALEIASLLLLIVVIGYSVVTLSIMLSEASIKSDPLERKTIKLALGFAATQEALSVLLLWWRQYRGARELLNGLQRLDAVVRDSDTTRWPWHPALPYLVGGLFSAGATFSILSQSFTSSRILSPLPLSTALLLTLPISIFSWNVGLFTYFVQRIGRHADRINADLQAMVDKEERMTPEDVTAMRRRYKELYGMMRNACYCFGPQILMEMGQDLWWITRQTFYIINMDEPLLETFTAVIDALKSILSKVCLLAVAHQVSETATNCLTLIHCVRNSGVLCMQYRQELEEFSRQVYQQPLRVSVMGVVCLDLRFLLQAAGIIMAYVVVLQQFEDSAQKEVS